MIGNLFDFLKGNRDEPVNGMFAIPLGDPFTALYLVTGIEDSCIEIRARRTAQIGG